MKRLFIIQDNKKKYTSKSISGYKKSNLLKIFESSLVTKDYYHSLYFGIEIIASGYYKEFWRIIFLLSTQYIHILSPNLPKIIYNTYNFYKTLEKKLKKKKINILEIRNIFEFQKQIIFLIKNISTNNKKHISYFIRKQYSNQQKRIIRNIGNLTPLFKRLKIIIKVLIFNKINKKQNSEMTLHDLFDIIGKLLSVDCELDNHYDKPFYIKLYHHKQSKINDDITGLIWNILLTNSKVNQYIWIQIVSIYNMYNSKILYKIEKESYHILHALFYLIYNYNDKPLITIRKEDISYIDRFYTNIQNSLDNDKKRNDYIRIDKDKNKKVSLNKINTKIINKNVITHKTKFKKEVVNINPMKYTTYTNKIKKPIKIINNNNKVIEDPEKIIEKTEKKKISFSPDITEDIYLNSIIEDNNEDEEEEIEIDIVIDNDEENQDVNFYYNFDLLDDKKEIMENKNNKISTETKDFYVSKNNNPEYTRKNHININKI